MLEELARFATPYNLLFLLQGALVTLLLSLVGSVAGLVLGLGLAILRDGSFPRSLRFAAILYVETFRRVPFLVTLMLVFFSLQLSGFDVPLLVIGMVSVCLIASAYLSEIIRAGLRSVHRNQLDSAAVANFTYWQTLRFVVLPQAWRVILPPAFAFFLMFIKDSALASQIGVIELTYVGKVLNNKGFSPAISFGSILVLYFAISYPLARLGRSLELRLAPARHR